MAGPIQSKLRLKERRRRLVWVKVGAGASVVVLLLVLVFYVSHLPQITVSQINISGTNLVSTAAVQAIVSEKLAGSYLLVIPRTNGFFVPTASIEGAIESAFPPVKSVSISTEKFKTLNVAIAEREPTALWCTGIPTGEISDDDNNATSTDDSSEANCYLMDGTGFIFASAATTTGYVAYYGSVSGNPIGTSYLGGGFASLQKELGEIAASIHRTPTETLVDNNEGDVSVAFAEGGVLRFTRTADPESTVENIASVFASQSFEQNTNFVYADFRFGDKVYVKFQ